MNRGYLLQCLELLKPALAKDATIPMFQNFCFDDQRVFAYNDSIGIIAPTEFNETFAVNGNILLGLLGASSAEEVTVELDGNDAVFTIGKSLSRLPFNNKDDFIFEPPDESTDTIPFTVSLYEAIKLCLESVSTDETQRALQGVTIEKNTMYSCDGDTVTRVKLNKPVKERVMLPTAFCSAVTKIWSSLGMTKGTLGFNEKWCVVLFEDWEIWGMLPQIDTPIDFEKEIKKTIKSKIELQPVPGALAEALKRARVLADLESAKTMIDVTNGKMRLDTSTHMGQVQDSIALKGHPDVHAAVSAAHLEKAIAVCDTFAVHDNCIILEKSPDIFMLVSNM